MAVNGGREFAPAKPSPGPLTAYARPYPAVSNSTSCPQLPPHRAVPSLGTLTEPAPSIAFESLTLADQDRRNAGVDGSHIPAAAPDLLRVLHSLGLEGYADSFAQEGFEKWRQLLDITESDLEHCGVKLGHRRRLQRAIQDALEGDRIPALQRAGTSRNWQPRRASGDPQVRSTDDATLPDGLGGQHQPAPKRKYRRHPKVDESAPERPPSAYVLFSNKIRERLKDQELSFTEIAKIVGETWQNPDPDERAECERDAAARKERYYTHLAEYKKTDEFSKYQEYLVDFRSKHGEAGSERSKKTKQRPSASEQGAEESNDEQSIKTDGASQAERSPLSFGATSVSDRSPVMTRRPGETSLNATPRPAPSGPGQRQPPADEVDGMDGIEPSRVRERSYMDGARPPPSRGHSGPGSPSTVPGSRYGFPGLPAPQEPSPTTYERQGYERAPDTRLRGPLEALPYYYTPPPRFPTQPESNLRTLPNPATTFPPVSMSGAPPDRLPPPSTLANPSSYQNPTSPIFAEPPTLPPIDVRRMLQMDGEGGRHGNHERQERRHGHGHGHDRRRDGERSDARRVKKEPR